MGAWVSFGWGGAVGGGGLANVERVNEGRACVLKTDVFGER